jgi:hypothetical protein
MHPSHRVPIHHCKGVHVPSFTCSVQGRHMIRGPQTTGTRSVIPHTCSSLRVLSLSLISFNVCSAASTAVSDTPRLSCCEHKQSTESAHGNLVIAEHVVFVHTRSTAAEVYPYASGLQILLWICAYKLVRLCQP